MDIQLRNACQGKSASQRGLNLKEFRSALVNKYPEASNKIRGATGRKGIEAVCKELMGDVVEKRIVGEKELPKVYCEDYTLIELAAKAGRGIRLSSADRERVCQELGLDKYLVKRAESIGFPRSRVLGVVKKLETGKPLSMEDNRLVENWYRNWNGIKDRLDNLAMRFVSGEELSEIQLNILDEELFNKYCRCVLKRKTRDRELLETRDINQIMRRLPAADKVKANKLIGTEIERWDMLSDTQKDTALVKIMPLFLGLSIGGCKSSVYIKSRHIKPRNRSCDYELSAAEIQLEKHGKTKK